MAPKAGQFAVRPFILEKFGAALGKILEDRAIGGHSERRAPGPSSCDLGSEIQIKPRKIF
jgi:hypothetical protein